MSVARLEKANLNVPSSLLTNWRLAVQWNPHHHHLVGCIHQRTWNVWALVQETVAGSLSESFLYCKNVCFLNYLTFESPYRTEVLVWHHPHICPSVVKPWATCLNISQMFSFFFVFWFFYPLSWLIKTILDLGSKWILYHVI